MLNDTLKTIEKLVPQAIKKSKEGEYSVRASYIIPPTEGDPEDKDLQKLIEKFPKFENHKNGSDKEEFFFDMLIDVVHLKQGVGFGELALINDAPRSAAIRAVTDVHFAILEKEDFKNILGKATRKRFAKMTKYLNQFSIFKNVSRLALEKFALFFKKEKASRGQKILKEQHPSGKVFFIESGAFEVSK
jgi:CRP-like cAMP-binding protein